MPWATFLLLASLAQSVVTGVVRDTTGGVVSGATVILKSGSTEQQAITGPNGRFTFEKVPADASLIVRAGGFAESVQTVAGTAEVEVVLMPATLLETVTVTPTRSEQRLGDVPASISILDSEAIDRSPALVADDVLRQLPTFSLFRRTSSLAAHPTTQGVSLRGIGPSGVSRTLVLVDDVPVNDPFGGWVYWTRVPLDGVERIEVVDGPSSSLYGNYAMGGVINIVSARPTARTLEVKPQYGNLNTPKLDAFGSDVWGRLAVGGNVSLFDTNGFEVVRENERGPVDTKAQVNFMNFSAKGDYAVSHNVSAFARVGYFREERDNAKVSTIDGTPEANDTKWTAVSGGVRAILPDSSALQARMFTDVERFRSNFMAVVSPPGGQPRSIGRMTLNQRVPTTGVGGMVQWGRAFGTRHYVSGGADWRWVDGDSNEQALDPVLGQTVTLERVSGGTQRSLGGFVQDILTLTTALTVTLSARVDDWQNYDGHNVETNVPSDTPGPGHNPDLPDQDDTSVSPRAAALYRVNHRVNLWGSISGGFRAPTLNELYRQFRVGTVLTLANPSLGPEHLVGGEAGVSLSLTPRSTLRSTWFDNRVENPVSNVTIATAGTQVTQQRQNLGRTRIHGIQTDLDYRLGNDWTTRFGYLYNRARVVENDVNPAVIGNYLPQVPKHRGSFQLAYSNSRVVNVALGVQFASDQFDDDQNTPSRVLPAYGVVDLQLSRAFSHNLEAFFGVQNLFDEEYFVGTLPTTIGTPRLVNAGFRLRFTGR